MSSMVLCGLTKVEVAVNEDDTITDMHPLANTLYEVPTSLRGSYVGAWCSHSSVGLGLLTYAYMLEDKGSSRALALAFASPSLTPKPWPTSRERSARQGACNRIAQIIRT
jgi:hypothetical protein